MTNVTALYFRFDALLPSYHRLNISGGRFSGHQAAYQANVTSFQTSSGNTLSHRFFTTIDDSMLVAIQHGNESRDSAFAANRILYIGTEESFSRPHSSKTFLINFNFRLLRLLLSVFDFIIIVHRFYHTYVTARGSWCFKQTNLTKKVASSACYNIPRNATAAVAADINNEICESCCDSAASHAAKKLKDKSNIACHFDLISDSESTQMQASSQHRHTTHNRSFSFSDSMTQRDKHDANCGISVRDSCFRHRQYAAVVMTITFSVCLLAATLTLDRTVLRQRFLLVRRWALEAFGST